MSKYKLPRDLRDLPPLLDVNPHLIALLGLSRNSCYRLLERGEVESVRIGDRVKVPRDRVLAQYGLLDDAPDEDEGPRPESDLKAEPARVRGGSVKKGTEHERQHHRTPTAQTAGDTWRPRQGRHRARDIP